METSSLFALTDGLEGASTTVIDHVLTISLVAVATSAICPLCAHAATHIRSSYTRHVADVPCANCCHRECCGSDVIGEFSEHNDIILPKAEVDTDQSSPELLHQCTHRYAAVLGIFAIVAIASAV